MTCLKRLRALRAFVPYTSSCLTSLHALHALRALLTRLIYEPCAPLSRALRALFVHLKIFLGWVCSPAETFHFPRAIKGTTNRALFLCESKNSRETFFLC